MSGHDILDDPAGLVKMARGLVQLGRAEAAMALAARALAERPGDPLLRELAHEITSDGIPAFHAPMLADEPRNRAYRAAIEQLAPGRRVLDIGTGTGLLAMCAARAGALRVDACEADVRIALTAREIVAANGLADRVSVIARRSTELDPVADLDGRADLVVSELFAENLLREGVIPALADARERLCRPGAVFLPARATIRVALARTESEPAMSGEVEGFDLSAFSRHLRSEWTVRSDSSGLSRCSEPADLFDFDFARPVAPGAHARLALIPDSAATGPATGVVQWLRLELAPGVTYENAPGTPESHWPLVYHPLPALRDAPAGEPVSICAFRHELGYRIWTG